MDYRLVPLMRNGVQERTLFGKLVWTVEFLDANEKWVPSGQLKFGEYDYVAPKLRHDHKDDCTRPHVANCNPDAGSAARTSQGVRKTVKRVGGAFRKVI